MAEFLEMEPLAIEVYSKLQYGDKAYILKELKSRSTYYWNENLKLVYEIEALSLPPEIHKQNQIIKDYCE
jgi:rhomboid protease GluP